MLKQITNQINSHHHFFLMSLFYHKKVNILQKNNIHPTCLGVKQCDNNKIYFTIFNPNRSINCLDGFGLVPVVVPTYRGEEHDQVQRLS